MVRLTPELIDSVDAYAEKADLSRSAAIRQMIDTALKAKAR
jgi:metal-responsive CopG/Arc/MetJ family transcriptional regulator